MRLLVGDLDYDTRVKGDLMDALAASGARWEPGQIVDEPIASVKQLWTQLARTDVVVATRFHNVLLALMLGKPVLALSYHEKVDSLMAAMGMAQYCHPVRALDPERLMEQFTMLEADATAIERSLYRQAEENRIALERQYEHIFRGF